MAEQKYEINFLTRNGGCPLVILISSKGMNVRDNNIVERIEANVKTKFDMCELVVFDWDDALTPWKVPQCLEGRDFSGGGEDFLRLIESEILPEINDFYKNHDEIYIAGYSLAGLFSLWSLYKSDIFNGAVCCSGSLWYPGWGEFASDNEIQSEAYIYLSLGDRESGGKNEILKRVGEVTKKQYEIMKKSDKTKKILFEHNKGGHFSDVDTRIVKGISRILSGLD